MHIISKKKLRDYYLANAAAQVPLTDWYNKMKRCQAKDVHDLRKLFNSVDPVDGYTIFNIGGNHYRLISAIHYDKQRCYIRNIWTHAEYGKTNNKTKLMRGKL